jgi:NAD-dependent DNA ligase
MATLEQVRLLFSADPMIAANAEHDDAERLTAELTEAGDPSPVAGDAFDEAMKATTTLRKLAGKTIAITGKLSRRRSEFHKLIIAAGGQFASRVNAWTTLLIVGTNKWAETEKQMRAQELGIERCSESDLLALIRGE